MDEKTEKIIKRYNRFSYIYDVFEKPMEYAMFNRWRYGLISPLKGKILEIGVGTGKNLKYYNKQTKVTAIDISSGMLSKAKERLEQLNNKEFQSRQTQVFFKPQMSRMQILEHSQDYKIKNNLEVGKQLNIKSNLSNKNIKLMEMDAQNLKFKDNSFDYVVCTFVLCSVPDPIKALEEMKRVCKKKGKISMIEHMLSKSKLIAFFEHLHNPITRTLFGFNVNRKTDENVEKAGLKIKKMDNMAFFDVFRKIEAGK